jgi:hypothetical protein
MIEGNTYKLYEIPRHSWIKFDSELMLFNKIDGMYSICMSKGKVVHLFAGTEVEYVGEFEGFEHTEGKEYQ